MSQVKIQDKAPGARDNPRNDNGPWLAIVGIGEDGVKGLTGEAKALIAGAELVVGGRRHLKLAGALIKSDTLVWRAPIADTLPDILARRGGAVAVLASGDPFWFGVGSTLAEHVPPREMIVLPQPSSTALAAARLGWAEQAVATVSLCGRPIEGLRSHLRDKARLFVLSADGATPAAVARYLVEHGFGPSRMVVLEALGGDRERCREAQANRFDIADINPLNLVALELDATPAALSFPLVPGRAEDWFDHDGQITRADIRAMVIARLNPSPGAMLWDIGAGSGAVGIEWLLACPDVHAIAVDRNAERLARASCNASNLGVAGFEAVEGEAPEILEGLPAPDAVFVGGGASRDGVLAQCWQALAPGGRLVTTAVTVETSQVLQDAYLRWGGNLTRISIERASPVGGFHGFRPAMPVLLYAAVKP